MGSDDDKKKKSKSKGKSKSKKEESEEESDDDDKKRKSKSKGKSKSKKEESKEPKEKKPLSGFMLWLKENRPALKEKHPDLSVTDIARKGGEEWKKLSDKVKAKYNAKKE